MPLRRHAHRTRTSWIHNQACQTRCRWRVIDHDRWHVFAADRDRDGSGPTTWSRSGWPGARATRPRRAALRLARATDRRAFMNSALRAGSVLRPYARHEGTERHGIDALYGRNGPMGVADANSESAGCRFESYAAHQSHLHQPTNVDPATAHPDQLISVAHPGSVRASHRRCSHGTVSVPASRRLPTAPSRSTVASPSGRTTPSCSRCFCFRSHALPTALRLPWSGRSALGTPRPDRSRRGAASGAETAPSGASPC
jgi:hypothetical protein